MDVKQLTAQCSAALQQKDLKRAHQMALALIQKKPTQPEGYFYIAQVPMLAKQYDTAIPILDKALALCEEQALIETDPKKALYIAITARLMQCFGMTGQADRALALFKQLPMDSFGPDIDSLDLEKIAVTLTRFEWHGLALPIFERVINSAKFTALSLVQQANVHCNIAASYAYQGMTSGALAHYQKSITCEPSLGKAQLALSRLLPSGESSRIKHLEALEYKDEVNPLYRANALFYELEKQGDYIQAGQVLQASNSHYQSYLEQTGRAFSLGRHTEFINSIRVLADRVYRQIGSIHNETASQPSPVFIVGLPRSGSTLLDSRITATHQQVVSLGERDDIERLVTPVLKQIRTLNKDDNHARPLPESVLNCLLEIPTKYQALTTARLEGLRENMHISGQNMVSHVLDKMHLNIWYTPLILALFPNAKVIAVKKNDQDLAWGNYKYLFNPQDQRFFYSYDLTNIQSYIDSYHQQIAWLQRRYPTRVVEVEYEHFVDSSRSVLQDLTEFLEIDNALQPKSDGHSKQQQNVATIYSTASAQQIKEGISKKYIGQWQRYGDIIKKSLNPGRLNSD